MVGSDDDDGDGAIVWYRRAADLGDGGAMMFLSQLGDDRAS